ncbi:hypothetical protein QBC35DRAFT_463620 [Podospora australis]|uniref:Uncharacterized protein n=1 Tax=Podospora australis TaxID=1536484 RepID=A0AAN6WW98_9PEZI|nr:hypothetical protein QBC35DRAFT_463620 [Podospora australis]
MANSITFIGRILRILSPEDRTSRLPTAAFRTKKAMLNRPHANSQEALLKGLLQEAAPLIPIKVVYASQNNGVALLHQQIESMIDYDMSAVLGLPNNDVPARRELIGNTSQRCVRAVRDLFRLNESLDLSDDLVKKLRRKLVEYHDANPTEPILLAAVEPIGALYLDIIVARLEGNQQWDWDQDAQSLRREATRLNNNSGRQFDWSV